MDAGRPDTDSRMPGSPFRTVTKSLRGSIIGHATMARSKIHACRRREVAVPIQRLAISLILSGFMGAPSVTHAVPLPMFSAPAATGTADGETARREYWKTIFDAMKDGSYQRRFSEKDWQHRGGFPETCWEDIPILLRHADSDMPLRCFPYRRNTFGVAMRGLCSEGILALYLIEGVRREGQWPLRPWCVKNGKKLEEQEADSLTNRKEAAERYRKWWDTVRAMDRPQAAKIDPLTGSSLRWYDGTSRTVSARPE
jgi:hypothetical protein